MATLYESPSHTPASAPRRIERRPAERYNADMRLWMRMMLWATRNCRH